MFAQLELVPLLAFVQVVIPGNIYHTPDICLSHRCIQSSSRILQLMDPSQDPCHDFYAFACWRYEPRSLTGPEEPIHGVIQDIQELVNHQVKELLTEKQSPEDLELFHLPKAYYKSCMNLNENKQESIQLVQSQLESLGGWPLLKGLEWNASVSWMEYAAQALALGVDLGFLPSIVPMGEIVVMTATDPLTLPHQDLIEGLTNTKVRRYMRYMEKVALTLGLRADLLAHLEMAEILDLEMTMAQLWLDDSEPTSLHEIHEALNGTFSWRKHLEHGSNGSMDVPADDKILVFNPQVFIQLPELLSRTNPRKLANFLGWRYASMVAFFLDPTLYSLDPTIVDARPPERWETCLRATISEEFGGLLAPLVGNRYLTRYLPSNFRDTLVSVFQEVQDGLGLVVNESDWIDEASKVVIRDKLHSVSSVLGSWDQIMDLDALQRLYGNLSFTPDNFLANWLGLTTKIQIDLSNGIPLWIVHAHSLLDTNAGYDFLNHEIRIIAGILEEPLFDSLALAFENFGGIGFVIGHELMHAFDADNFFLHMEHLNHTNVSQELSQRFNCTRDQYANTFSLNGTLTLSENLADIGGMRAAYRAYEKFIDGSQVPVHLPGLNFSPRQLFWVSYAQNWCTKYTEVGLNLALQGVHSPAFARVNGALMNNLDFARDFQCQAGSQMVPKHPCRLW